MSIEALKNYTFVSRYARYDAIKKRRETWDEAVERVKQMHLKRYPFVKKEIDWAFEQVHQKRVLGSQRALQFGGKPIENKNARLFNCVASFCDRLRFFQECFWLLLCGTGTGFSVQKHHVDKLPKFKWHKRNVFNEHHNLPTKYFVIPDSIEGWADALGVLLSSYFEDPVFPQFADYNVKFDYSQIREAGSPLNSCSGKAPGPEPLHRSLEKIRGLLNRCLKNGQDCLRTIDAYDIVMHAADAVLSGGIRRSATLCMFSIDDEDMLSAKTGNWFYDNPQRSRSNNSAILLRDEVTKSEFLSIIDKIKEFGEPGFIWSDSLDVVFNPCVEVSLYPIDIETGKTGWQACNLCEINGGKLLTKDDFIAASHAAAIIGTLQAGYTSFPYLGEISENIIRREALLGVSITGVMDNPSLILNPDTLQEMAQLILAVNENIANKIGINKCARATCLKPGGTTSCMLGTASGIHPHHWRKYLRRVQNNKMEAPLQHFATINPCAVEDSVWSANKTDSIITFCIDVPESASTKRELSAVELLSKVKKVQQNWVIPGKRPDQCVQPWLTHNVSNTCFSGNTRFVTDKGLKRFDAFKDGDVVNSLNYQGEFVPSLIKSFGEQEIWELVLSNGKSQVTIETTANHIWLVSGRKTKFQRLTDRSLCNYHLGFRMVKTYNLDKLSSAFQIPKVFSVVPNKTLIPLAFCHGFVFGDGSKHYKFPDSNTHVCIYDVCKMELAEFFGKHIEGCSVIKHDDFVYVGKLDPKWKELPETLDSDYIFSFISGWFAADGSIGSQNDNQRAIRLTSKNRQALEWLISVCQIAGIGTSGFIRSFVQNKGGYKPGEIYHTITLVKSTLSDEFFINHSEKYKQWLGQKSKIQASKYFSIVECKKTNRVESVYCVVEPKTSTFVLENNILTHNCNVKEHEWKEVGDFIYENRKYFAGIAMLPETGDLDYQQAPMVAILTAEELVEKYGSGCLLASGLIVDGLTAFGNLWLACDAALGLGEYESIMNWEIANPNDAHFINEVSDFIKWKEGRDANNLKKDWIRRARQFSARYFEDDRKMCYCLKQVSLYKTWLDLNREYKPVDYTNCIEEEDNTKLIGEIACAGGACQVI